MGLLGEITPQLLLLRLGGYVVFAGWHGFMLALIARLLGDRTPAYAGRLTPSPFVQVTTSGMFMAALFQMGWITPMRMKPQNMRFGRFGLVLCVFGSVAATLALVLLINPLRPLLASTLTGTPAFTSLLFLQKVQEVTIESAVLNLLPIPMLTGGLLLLALFPGSERRLRKLEPIGMGLLVVALIAGFVPSPLPLVAPLLMGGR